MKPIPQRIIDEIPDKVTPDRESCEYAADKGLLLLFMIGAEATSPLTFPPIISTNGRELWPLPPPWTSDEENKRQLLENLNGDSEKNQTGLLSHTKANGEAYNKALASGAIPEAERIVAMMPGDSASLWSDCNALVASTIDEDIYQSLELSNETHVAFQVASGVSRFD